MRTTELLERALGLQGSTVKVGHVKTAAQRWLHDGQLTKLCNACKARKKK